MDDKRIADYFVIAGVPAQPRKCGETLSTLEPITDIAVIIRSNNEPVPKDFVCIETTPTGHKADLNHGSYRSPSIFICVRRGKDKPPLVDIGVLYDEGKERLIQNCNVIKKTPSGFSANVNNSGTQTYLTYRRASDEAPANQLVVTDVCVILASKAESPPHAYMLIDKNLNKGMFGSDVYLCYKKSMHRPPFLSYNPVVIDRFPLEDYPEFPLSEHLPNFCLPMGASIECWPRKAHKPHPSYSTFVLTLNSGDKIYASLLNFYETILPDELTIEELKHLKYFDEDDEELDNSKISDSKTLNRIKSICILSHWPFFDQFKRFLSFLCKMFCTANHPPASLEAYIFSFMKDIPFPSPERPNILVNLLSVSTEEATLLFEQTFDDLPIPSNGASFKKLLFNLGPENCLHVLLFALTEQKILIHSLRPSVLTEVAEAITTMIFPFNWHCPYIPMCPMNMSAVLHAPLPFLVGIDSRYFDYFVLPNDVASIDIDTKAIYLSETKRSFNLKMLPKKETKTLRTTLEEIYERLRTSYDSRVTDVNMRRKLDKQIETEIQEAFLCYMASILKDFRHYLKPITAAPKVGATDPGSLFDMQGFISSRDSNHQIFYKSLIKTQMFTKFIEERSLVSDKNVSLAFFDECIEKVEKFEKSLQKNGLNLIDFDDQSNIKKTVFITIPDAVPTTPQEKEMTHENAKHVPQFFGPLNHQKFYKLQIDHSSSTATSARQMEGGSKNQLTTEDYPDSAQFNSELQTYMFARRAKHEIRKAQKIAQQAAQSPVEWAKHLLVNAYSLWFTHFPSFSHVLLACKSDQKPNPLSVAYHVLQRMQTMTISTPDEFCYRILMILCGIHSQPALAVKVFLDMQKHQVRLNAITYGYYNKAVLEGNWPTNYKHAKWAKLRNTCRVVFFFKRFIKHTESNHRLNGSSSKHERANSVSKSQDIIKPELTTKSCSEAMCNNNNNSSKTNAPIDYSESAGLLISGQLSVNSNPDRPRSPQFRKRHKSAGSKPNNLPTSGGKFEAIHSLKNGNVTSLQSEEGDSISNLESSKSDIHRETTSESSRSVKGSSDENLNDSFSSRFATPIKEAFTNMDIFSPKSRMGSTLRSSFRFAKSFTKTSKYGLPRSSTFHSEKSPNKDDSLQSKRDEIDASSKSTPPRLPRSSTLPQSFPEESSNVSTPTNDSKTLSSTMTSPWANKLSSGKHAEYVYSTYKLAANRINELKSSFSTTNSASPVKLNMANVMASSNYLISQLRNFAFDDDDTINDKSIDPNTNQFESNESLEILDGYRDLFNSLNGFYRTDIEALKLIGTNCDTVLRLEMVSCTLCRICNSIVYDEEIMCKWGAEDSNLNTKCIYCNCTFVPSLTISIKDYRNKDGQIDQSKSQMLDPVSVPYLSPLVLRKELENILYNEGYTSLIRCKFVDDHPIVYWNLLWYFTRLNLPSHISALVLSAPSLNSPELIKASEGYTFQNVSIVCMWENEKLNENTLHRRWLKLKNNKFSEKSNDSEIIPQLIECIRNKDVNKPIQYLISERTKRKSVTEPASRQFNSIYRELLFLTLMEISDQIISLDTFDLEYHKAFESLSSKEKESLDVIDNPPSIGAIFCRNLFKPLSL